MKNIVSKNAEKYFKDNNITSIEWINFCQKEFNLVNGDVVYYERNEIGYMKNNKRSN